MRKSFVFCATALALFHFSSYASASANEPETPVQPTPAAPTAPAPEWVPVENGQVVSALVDAISATQFRDCKNAGTYLISSEAPKASWEILFTNFPQLTVLQKSDTTAQPAYRVKDSSGTEVDITTDTNHRLVTEINMNRVDVTQVNTGTIAQPNYEEVRTVTPLLSCHAL